MARPTKKRSSSEKQLKRMINLLSRDEKVDLLRQLDCAYFKVYNMEYSNIIQAGIQTDALCELVIIHNIVKKSLR